MSELAETDYVAVAKAAQELGVGRNEMHRILVGRKKILGEQFYLWGNLQKWAAQDINSPNSLLQKLREKKKATVLKKEKRAHPHTKTGKIKKRFQRPQLANCADCGARLTEDYEYEDWGENDPPSPDDDGLLLKPGEVNRGGRHRIPVNQKGRRGTRYVTMDLDQEKEKQAILKQLAPRPKFKILSCSNSSCEFRVWQQLNDPMTGLSMPGAPDYDDFDDYDYDESDLSRPIDDDVLAMTTTVLSDEGEVLGDLGDSDKDDDTY